jgi:hypothetical protein
VPPEPAGGLVLVLEYEIHYALLLSACEEVIARGEEPTKEDVLLEAETLLREYGGQWVALTGHEDYTRWAEEEIEDLFWVEIEDGEIKGR